MAASGSSPRCTPSAAGKRLPGFSLTHQVEGVWARSDRAGAPIVIDLVGLDENSRTIRLGMCKRQGDKLVADLGRFDHHVRGFLSVVPRFAAWHVERVAIAPALTKAQRTAVENFGYLAQDLGDLTSGL
jgi:hypothetical protein